MTKHPRELATFTDYPGMLAALRARAAERRIATGGDNAATLAGLPDRYLGKVLGARPVRRIGMTSLGPILGLLGVKLIMVEDLEAIARLASRIEPRNESYVRSGAMNITLTRRFLKKIGSKGGKARKASISKRYARAIARKAILTRHADGPAAKRANKAKRAADKRWGKPAAPPPEPQNAGATPAAIAAHASR